MRCSLCAIRIAEDVRFRRGSAEGTLLVPDGLAGHVESVVPVRRRGRGLSSRSSPWSTAASSAAISSHRRGVHQRAHELDQVEITYETPLDLVSGCSLTYGEIVCLAGNFLAHLDGEAARKFADAWPPLDGLPRLLAGSDYRKATLAHASGEAIDALLKAIHGEGYQLDDGARQPARISQTSLLRARQPELLPFRIARSKRDERGARAVPPLSRPRTQARRGRRDDEDAWMRAVVTEAFRVPLPDGPVRDGPHAHAAPRAANASASCGAHCG